jgi:hypothetical protein
MKLSIFLFCAALLSGLGCARGQSATPTPGPVGTASTALNSSLTGGGTVNGQGSMGTGVNAPPSSATPAIVPGAVVINANGSSVGTGNVAGSVQLNNGGPGSVSGAPTPTSPIPTYVVPGSGLGTAAGTGITVPNPNPGSVQ